MARKFAFLTLILSLALGACAPLATSTPAPTVAPTGIPTLAAPTAEPSAVPLNFTDGLGRVIQLPAPAQKIVSLAPSNTEILFAIGAGGQTIGRDMFSDYPEAAKTLPDVGGSMGEYNLEAIAALQPDLVLAAEINTEAQVKALEDLGLTVYYLKNPLTLDEMYANLKIVAELTGHESEAAALIESLQTRVAAVTEKLAAATSQPSVFYEVDGSDPAKPYSAGPGTFIDALITLAGGTNLVTLAGISDAYPQVSLEQVVATPPDVILLGDAMWGTTPEMVAQRPGWETLPAVSAGQVFAFDDNLVSRPGPRLVDGLESLAKLLHPELFQ